MVELNDKQVDFIHQQLFNNPLENNELQGDLLDHFCCFVENQMSLGFSFQESLSKASQAIAPNGVKEIEDELFFIVHLKPQITMKRILYFSSFVFAFTLCLNFLFKTMHWPYANKLLLIANTTLLFLTLPSLTVLGFRNRALLNKKDKLRMVTGILSGFMISIGVMFKALHFPMAGVLFGTGFIIFSFVFLPIFFHQLYKKSVQKA